MSERVTGVGGVFLRARDPQALAEWYGQALGVEDNRAGETVWAAFAPDTDYFGEQTQQVMINYTVSDLDAMLEQLRAAGASVHDNIETSQYGRFGWATDPEGNRIELWEPAPGQR